MEPNNTSTPTAEPKVNLASVLNSMPPVQPAPTPVTPVTPPPRVTPPPVVPPTPPTPPAPQGDHKEIRVILPALLVLLIIAAGYYWYINRTPSAPYTPPTSTTTPQQNTGSTSLSQIAKPLDIPNGFPTDIPVEKANLTEGYSINYKDYNVTQYTVAYTSSKTKDALWTTYNSYLITNGYKLNSLVTNKAQGVMDGTKNKDELNIVITTRGTGSYVQMTYVKR